MSTENPNGSVLGRSFMSALDADALNTIQRGVMEYSWKGVNTRKNPFDISLYMRLFWELKPRTIFELGSCYGGSALWMADICTECFDIDTHIYSLDIEPVRGLSDERITFITGDARQLNEYFSETQLNSLPRPWLVIDDADHTYTTSKAIVEFFDPWMRSGEYLIVEDGVVEPMGAADRYDGGPNRAIKEFLQDRGEHWEIDAGYCDWFGHNVTWNTNGYLRRR